MKTTGWHDGASLGMLCEQGRAVKGHCERSGWDGDSAADEWEQLLNEQLIIRLQ